MPNKIGINNIRNPSGRSEQGEVHIHCSQVPWGPNFVQNGDPMGTRFWVRWGPNGDLRQHKWGPNERISKIVSFPSSPMKSMNRLFFRGTVRNEKGTVVVVFVLGLWIYLTNFYFRAQQLFEQTITDVVEICISQIDDYSLESAQKMDTVVLAPMWPTQFPVQEPQHCECFQTQAGE